MLRKQVSSLELLHDFQRQIQLIPRAIVLGFLILCTYSYLKDINDKKINKLRNIFLQPWISAFFVYAGLLSLITIFARDMVNPYQHILSDFGVLREGKLNLEFVENTALFVPYTFLYLQAFKPSTGWRSGMIVTLYTTFCIEVFQLVFWMGEFQLSDIVHNTLGGLIGCGLWHLEEWVKKQIKLHL